MQTIETSNGLAGMVGFRYHENLQTLDITSNCGTVYQYFNVPQTIIDELKKADDKAAYYKDSIRGKFKRLFKAWDYSVFL